MTIEEMDGQIDLLCTQIADKQASRERMHNHCQAAEREIALMRMHMRALFKDKDEALNAMEKNPDA